MRALVRMSVLFVLAALALAACGGGAGGSPSTAASPAASVGTESTAPSEGAPSTEPSDEPSAAPSTGGGGTTAVCDLVTAEELAGVFGVASVTTTVIPGPPDNCIVNSDTGDPLTAFSLSLAQAQTVYAALTSDPSTVEVSGIGDKAAIVQNTGLLVLKGDALLVISISGGADMSEEEAVEASKAIGSFAAPRM